MAVTGKLFSVLVESANFAVTVEIRGVDTRVVAVWSAGCEPIKIKLSSDIYILQDSLPRIRKNVMEEVMALGSFD